MTIGRNDACPCGSGLKYKRCCLRKDEEIDASVRENSQRGEKARELAGLSIEELKSRFASAPTEAERVSLGFPLAQAHQERGEYQAALELLHALPKGDAAFELVRAHLSAASVNALGGFAEAAKMYDALLADPAFAGLDPLTKADVTMEAGKANSFADKNARAAELWNISLAQYKALSDLSGIARAESNLAFLLLHHIDPNEQERGVTIMERSSVVKAEVGDLEGLANNYCTLALHFWRKKRYARSLAYMRRDLRATRATGNLRSLCSTLCNLAGLYVDLKQLSPARKLVKEAADISVKLDDSYSTTLAKMNLQRLEEAAKVAGLAGEVIGPKAPCACGSDEQYQNCCGRADHEPVVLPKMGVSEEAGNLVKELKERKVEPSRLDFILRSSDGASRRTSWTRVAFRDGWCELYELPDMANSYLSCVEQLSKSALEHPDSMDDPLSAVILASCALEAFINQISFFVLDLPDSDKTWTGSLPQQLSLGALNFQRSVSLAEKWGIVGGLVCGSKWPIPEWDAAAKLIDIRNELVHFKSGDYEQIDPSPALDVDIMRRIPKSISLRPVPRAWPYRLLTPSLAAWAYRTAQSTIAGFKTAFRQERVEKGSAPKGPLT
jgi:tetratricopeptide (TPR) repeat protein